MPVLGEFGGKRPRELFPVDRLDHIEQRDGLSDLVGLQRPDQMELDIGKRVPERGPFAGGFLDTVLAEDTMTRLEHRTNFLGGVSFGRPRRVLPNPGDRPAAASAARTRALIALRLAVTSVTLV